MSVRLPASHDYTTVVTILAQAFRHESYISFLHPSPASSEESFARDLQRYWRRHIRPKWYDGQHQFLVSTDEDGAVVATAVWKSPTPSRRGKIQWVKNRLYSYFAELLNSIDTFLFPDTSIDHMRANAFTQALPLFQHHFTSLGPHWSLEYLGVLPSVQKQGYGRALVEWGLQQAKVDGVPAAVICSAGSEEFYGKCGFGLRVGNVTEGQGNPLASVKGGEILIWYP